MSKETAISVENVYKRFLLPHERVSTIKGLFTSLYKEHDRSIEVQHALKDISFEVRKGEFFGIVGRNGSGKSTLLKILAGIYQPTTGHVQTRGKLVPFIELGVGFNPELTGRENVYLNGALIGFSRDEVDAMYNDIVSFAELERFMDQKLKNYSSGMQVRLAFSLAIRADADILLVDEVLAVGDADFQRKCFQYFRNLKKNKKTVIFVSHDMNAVEEYCDRAILIEHSELVIAGTSHEVARAYTRMFLEQDAKVEDQAKKKRWGSEDVRFDTVSVRPGDLTTEKDCEVSATIEVLKNTAELVLGFKFRQEDDSPLVGTNTKLKKKYLHDLKKGERISVTWTVPNIFNTGKYYVDVAAQNEDYSVVYDWWEDAAEFLVERGEDSSYSVMPIIQTIVERSK